MSSKNNPDARKAAKGAANNLVPMNRQKSCIDCGGTVRFACDQEMVMVGRRMQARHKKDTGGKCQDSTAKYEAARTPAPVVVETEAVAA